MAHPLILPAPSPPILYDQSLKSYLSTFSFWSLRRFEKFESSHPSVPNHKGSNSRGWEHSASHSSASSEDAIHWYTVSHVYEITTFDQLTIMQAASYIC